MPVSDPAVGEVWQNGDTEAIVIATDTTNGTLTLLSRLGRQVVCGGGNGFTALWTRKDLAPSPFRCCVDKCDSPGLLRTLNQQPFCLQHVPRNQPLFFPGDTPDVLKGLKAQYPQCPVCDKERHTNNSWVLIGNIVTHRCSCRARWVQITTRGTASDGLDLAEDLQSAYNLLELELCANIRALVGNHAWGSLARSFGELRKAKEGSATFLGMKLQLDNSRGTSNITLMGAPAASNEEELPIQVVELGTYWRLSESTAVVRVFAIDPEFVWVLENGLPAKITAKMLRDRYDRIKAPEKVPEVEVPRVPMTGETWWSVPDNEPVQIVSLGEFQGEDGTKLVVNYSKGRRSGSTRILLQDFVQRFKTESIVSQWKVGDEYELDDQTFFLHSIQDRNVLLVNSDEQLQTVSFTEFYGYRRVVRKSQLEHLMSEDDF